MGDRCVRSGEETRATERGIAACWCGAIVPTVRIPGAVRSVTVLGAHDVPCRHSWAPDDRDRARAVCLLCGQTSRHTIG